MIYKFSSAAALVAFCLCAQAAIAQTQTSTNDSHSSPSATHKSASGEQTITGCVVRQGDEFVLKTKEGTYAFDTVRDLSPYVGKKVRISGKWKATGITTAAPAEAKSSSAEEPASGESAAKSAAGAPQAFAGELHLHISGAVIGDCESPK